MVEKLLQEANTKTQSALQEKHYPRLIRGDHIPQVEALEGDVPTRLRQRLTDEEIQKWNCVVDRASQLLEQISLVHQLIRDDDESPSRYRPAYKTLWSQYRDAVRSLRKLDPEAVNRFRAKVIARVKELEARIEDLCDDWEPIYFDYFEQTLVCYEETHDLMVALDESSPLSDAEEIVRRTREHLASKGWCSWQCRVLGNEVIAVARGENVKDIARGYPVYTEDELEKLFSNDVSNSTLRLVHEAKKLAGAVVASVSREIKENNPYT